jgi:arginase
VSAGFAVIEAPSPLGLFPGGVEQLADTLLAAGLADRLGARRAGRVPTPPYDAAPHPTGVRNAEAIAAHAEALAAMTGAVIDAGEFPVVLGGDCSILLGDALALRRRGRYGLLFLDGHADFYQPEAEPNGEAASMDLALATGRGPELLTCFDGYRQLVDDADVAVLGRRDADEAEAAGSQRIEDTSIVMIDLDEVRRVGIEQASAIAIEHVGRPELDGFWIHLDCDVLDDAVMPAVGYRLPGGLAWGELVAVIAAAMRSGRAVGIEITIFDPSRDPDGRIAAELVEHLVAGLVAG